MSSRDDAQVGASPSTFDTSSPLGGAPPTYAAFSPVTLSANTPSRNSRRSTVLVHQKSPLLLATPPQITRALAYSYPFLLPLNSFVGLLTWTTGDPWQSFLLLSAFWAVVLYGDVVLTRAGPVVLGAAFIAGMYSRRFSPLSSSAFTKDAVPRKPSGTNAAGGHSDDDATERQPRHARAISGVPPMTPTTPTPPTTTTTNANTKTSKASNKNQKTLDQIVETLREFTGRCNMLMDPLLEMTDFLSTQRTPTSATTKPALTAMFVRLLIVTPFWVALTMSPWRIITARRVVLVTGTIMLTWHSRVMRVTRAIMWRSASVRRLAGAITGLVFEGPVKTPDASVSGASPSEAKQQQQQQETGDAKASSLGAAGGLHLNHWRNGGSREAKSASVKFTFILYENQRRWVGLGWTSSLFAYERPAWTDEHQNGVPHKDEFELPGVEDGSRMRWRWAEGSRWRVDGIADDQGIDYDGPQGSNGWIYYDNKWQNGRRGSDGWGKWTRRRKWYRDAELVEVSEEPAAQELEATETVPQLHTESYSTANEKMRVEPPLPPRGKTVYAEDVADSLRKAGDDAGSLSSVSSRFWPSSFRWRGALATDQQSSSSGRSVRSSSQGHGRAGSVYSDHHTSATEEETGLEFAMELEMQKQNKDGGQWGIGDEARMNLE